MVQYMLKKQYVNLKVMKQFRWKDNLFVLFNASVLFISQTYKSFTLSHLSELFVLFSFFLFAKSPRLYLSVVIFFWFFWINASNAFSVRNWIPLKPVLGSVRDVAHVIISYEQTHWNRVCNFHFFILIWLLSRCRLLSEFYLLVF